MARKNIGAKPYIMPMPVLMLSAYEVENEKPADKFESSFIPSSAGGSGCSRWATDLGCLFKKLTGITPSWSVLHSF